MMGYGMRPSSKGVRAKRYGTANQMAYEARETAEREKTKARMAETKKATARRASALKRKPERGMNSGSIGASWLSGMMGK